MQIHRAYVGEFATSMEMAGASLTFFRLDDELTELLDHPASTPSRTPTKSASPGQGTGDEAQDNPETPEATVEPTSTGDSQSGDLQGPQ